MISEDITFLSVFWLELAAITVPVVIFLLATTVFHYLQLVELKFAAGVVLATIGVAIYAMTIWETETWRAFLYAFGAMFLAAIPWAILLTLVNQFIEKYGNRKPRTMDADLDVKRLVEWSLHCAQDNKNLFPAWCSVSMNCTVLWYAMPVIVALKCKEFGAPLNDFLLDDIVSGTERAVHTSLFGEQVDDDELREVKVVLSQYTRHVIIFWLTAFDEFAAQQFFGDQPLLAKMLTGLIEDPEYELFAQLGVEDEDDLSTLTGALAAHIKACYARVPELTRRINT